MVIIFWFYLLPAVIVYLFGKFYLIGTEKHILHFMAFTPIYNLSLSVLIVLYLLL